MRALEMQMKHHTAYYWTGRQNFGDRLTPLLFKHFTGLHLELAPFREAELICVGSILDIMPSYWSGIVAGAGMLRENSLVDVTHARVLALRGPLTASKVKGLGHSDYALGDPGLLADELVGAQCRTHNLGIVPHWSDTQLEKRPEFLKYDPLIIRPDEDPLEVIRKIGSCKKIVASSLHGIILADAFGIPRRTEIAAQHAKEGGTFKFQDYNAAISNPFELGKTQEPKRSKVIARQHELYDVLVEAAGMLRPWR